MHAHAPINALLDVPQPRLPAHLTGALKQQGAAHVKNIGWSMWRRSMDMSQKPRVASSMGVNCMRQGRAGQARAAQRQAGMNMCGAQACSQQPPSCSAGPSPGAICPQLTPDSPLASAG